MKKLALTALAAFAALAQPVAADPISIVNPSFEQPALGPGGFTVGFPGGSGWTTDSGFNGIFRPVVGVHFTVGVPDGVQSAYANSGTFSQTLSATLQPNTRYDLLVLLGDRLDTTFPSVTLNLFAGATLLAPTLSSISLPSNGGFDAFTARTFFIDHLHPALGQQLRIQIGASATQANFDLVQLNATFIPEPASLVVFALAVTGLWTCGRRRRHGRG